MKGIILQPTVADENVIVQFTQNVIIEKNTVVKVPNGFKAIILIDEKVTFRMNEGATKKLSEYGKDYIGKRGKIAFVHTKMLPAMLWGFGNIQVNNDRLKEAYRVGANGKYVVEIVDIAKLISAFNVENNITTEKVRDRTISIIRNLGNAVLGKCFAKTDISVFEIASQIENIRDELFNSLKNENAFSDIGFKLKDLTIEKIHVNEDDLEIIRNRINNAESTSSIEDLKVEISEIVSTELKQILQKQLDDFGANISAELEDIITERLPLCEEAKINNIKKVKLNAHTLLEQADENDDLVLLASLIYSKVEENLITKYKLPHRNEKFYMNYSEYLTAVYQAKSDDRYYLMERDKNGILKPLPPRVIELQSDGTPITVEMHPLIRFMRAGLSPQEAYRATVMWRVINKIRHRSEENKKKLDKFFAHNKSRKDYMKEVLDFYQEKLLYTED